MTTAQPGLMGVHGAVVSTRSIHAILRDDIIMLRLRPGMRLSENELALRFGTSRTPVREALIRLADEGLLEVLPQRGSFVSLISLRAMQRARFVRQALEIAIVREAAIKGLSPEDQGEVAASLAEQKRFAEDRERFTPADDRFHRAFAIGAGLLDVWAVLERERVHFDRIRFLSLPLTSSTEVLIAQHSKIFDAVKARDPDAAEVAMREHLSEVLRSAPQIAAAHPDLIANDP